MSRHFRYPKYTYLKDNTYYFSRSVPTDLRCFYTKPRIIQSLRTNSLLRAKTASKVFASKLDDQMSEYGYYIGFLGAVFGGRLGWLLGKNTFNQVLGD